MKQSRRKELKTNELSVYLQQIYETAARNSTYLIGGLVAVVLVLVVGLYVQHGRDRALQAAWGEYERIGGLEVVDQPALLDQAASLAAEYGDHSALGPLAMEQQANLAYDLALSLTATKDRARRIELLEGARDTYERLLDKFGDRPDVAARAFMVLAGIEESLVVAGAGDKEKARRWYQKLIEANPNPFQEMAGELLENLDERVRKLEVVATRPASATEPAPSTMPTPTTKAGPPAQSRPTTKPATQATGEGS